MTHKPNAAMWGGYRLKNRLCYNSRQSTWKLDLILRHFCRGTLAKDAAVDISKEKGKITRQTVAKHYQQIGLILLRDPEVFKRFTWWNVQWPTGWKRSSLTYKQLMHIRSVVFTQNNAIQDVRRGTARAGKARNPHHLTYIAVLREMAERMNGISRSTFEMHLGRACLLASFIDEGLKRSKAEEHMHWYLQRYFLDNPWLWSVKMTKRRNEGLGFYKKEAPLIPEDDAGYRWIKFGKDIDEKEATAWEKRRKYAMYDNAIDLGDDPHTLALTRLFRTRKTPRKRTPKIKGARSS